MDGMSNNFRNLSLGAAEWKPLAPPSNTRDVNKDRNSSNSTSNRNSDLNAGEVKEFIPGQGWTVPTSTAQMGITNTNESQIGRYIFYVLFYLLMIHQ